MAGEVADLLKKCDLLLRSVECLESWAMRIMGGYGVFLIAFLAVWEGIGTDPSEILFAAFLIASVATFFFRVLRRIRGC